jgi:hypothetical protein
MVRVAAITTVIAIQAAAKTTLEAATLIRLTVVVLVALNRKSMTTATTNITVGAVVEKLRVMSRVKLTKRDTAARRLWCKRK